MSDYQMREVYGKKVLTMNIPNGFKTLPPNACFRQLRKQEKLIAELEEQNNRLVELLREIEWTPNEHYVDGVPYDFRTRLRPAQYERLMELMGER